VYTGYTMEEIHAGAAGEEGVECLQYMDVLIDGRYVHSLNDPSCTLRGSSNQKIWYLTQGMEEKYAEYLAAGRKVENFIHRDHVVTVGIQNREEQ
ncbi:MAG: radical SAM protein, partial [Lachnospiraceae bacterium]|nr:radical SAM protein [Lachnospiraceae bacterium]